MKKIITLCLIGLSLLPFGFFVNQPASWSLASDNWKALSLWLSAYLGYVGVGIIFWQFALGTRSVSGLFQEDLSWSMRVHRFLGKYGSLLIFLHPMLIAYYYGERLVLYALIPNISTEFEKHVTFGRSALLLLAVIWITSAILRGRIGYRPWKYIHYIAYLLIPAVLLHAPEVGSSFANKGVQFYWYSFVGLFILLALLRLRYFLGFGKAKYVVAEHSKLTEHVHLLKLKPKAKSIKPRMGQFLYLQRGLWHEEHPFSVLYSLPDETISVAFKVFGKFTEKLAAITEGEELYLDGPYGTFTRELTIHPGRPVVCIAGGIGITPFVAHLIKNPNESTKPIRLFYANQTPETAALRDVMMQRLGAAYVDVFSKSETTGANIENGFVSKEIIQKYIENPQEYDYYLCGPLPMMQSVKVELKKLGIPKSSIRSEEFNF